jgi:hypothetical protein
MAGDYIVPRPYIYRITTYINWGSTTPVSGLEFHEMARIHIESLLPIARDRGEDA